MLPEDLGQAKSAGRLLAGDQPGISLATRRWSSKAIWMRSKAPCSYLVAIYRVLPKFWDRIFCFAM